MITHVLPSASGDTSRMSVKRLTRASLIAREGERLPDNHAHGTTAGLRRPIQCGAHDSPNLVVEARVSALHDPDGCGFHPSRRLERRFHDYRAARAEGSHLRRIANRRGPDAGAPAIHPGAGARP